jgi:hypothetical protein
MTASFTLGLLFGYCPFLAPVLSPTILAHSHTQQKLFPFITTISAIAYHISPDRSGWISMSELISCDGRLFVAPAPQGHHASI